MRKLWHLSLASQLVVVQLILIAAKDVRLLTERVIFPSKPSSRRVCAAIAPAKPAPAMMKLGLLFIGEPDRA